MKIIIEMPDVPDDICPVCKAEHPPREICEGFYMTPDYEGSDRRAKMIADSAKIVDKER